MPKAPRKVCRKSGCGRLTEHTFCEKHEHEKRVVQKQTFKELDKQRGSRHERGYTSKWSRYSVLYRQSNPICVMCEKRGIIKVANCVDHIVPVTGSDDPLFWEPTNHQSLCTACHSRKTAAEDGGFGNRKVNQNVR